MVQPGKTSGAAELTFKNLVLTVLQIPILVLMLVAVCCEYVMVKCLACLRNPLSTPVADLGEWVIPDYATAVPACLVGRESDIELLMERIVTADGDMLERLRSHLESMDYVKPMMASYPDRHLYAVLVPSRDEDLQRIRNALEVSPATRLTRWVSIIGWDS